MVVFHEALFRSYDTEKRKRLVGELDVNDRVLKLRRAEEESRKLMRLPALASYLGMMQSEASIVSGECSDMHDGQGSNGGIIKRTGFERMDLCRLVNLSCSTFFVL